MTTPNAVGDVIGWLLAAQVDASDAIKCAGKLIEAGISSKEALAQLTPAQAKKLTPPKVCKKIVAALKASQLQRTTATKRKRQSPALDGAIAIAIASGDGDGGGSSAGVVTAGLAWVPGEAPTVRTMCSYLQAQEGYRGQLEFAQTIAARGATTVELSEARLPPPAASRTGWSLMYLCARTSNFAAIGTHFLRLDLA